jgi:hypothetical protein
MKKAVILLMSCLLVSTNCLAVTVVGSVSCAKWKKDRDEDSWAKVANTAWLVGFFAGITDSTGKNYLAAANIDSLELAMDDYCQAHPFKNTYGGVWQKK